MSSPVEHVTRHACRVLRAWSIVLVYPLDHELVPRHRRATATERARLGPRQCLPSLRSDDVIAQYLALRIGDVVRIDRHDHTVYWRHIVSTHPSGTSAAGLAV